MAARLCSNHWKLFALEGEAFGYVINCLKIENPTIESSLNDHKILVKSIIYELGLITICVDLFISVLLLISTMSSESNLVIVFFRSAILNSSISLLCCNYVGKVTVSSSLAHAACLSCHTLFPIFISESKSSNPLTIAANFCFVDGWSFSVMMI